jgi:hypothetical protein
MVKMQAWSASKMNDHLVPTRLLSLSFRCCSCGNRTGLSEAFFLENGDLCCSRCAETRVLDEVELAVLVES